jgi:hypothetical protein
MDKMENYTILENIKLGKKDKLLNFNSKWPIFRLNLLDKKGLWTIFNEKLNILEQKGLLHEINLEYLNDFLYKNSDIQFEMLTMDHLLQDHVVFGFNDKTLCYSLGKYTKNTKNIIYVRFYFDIKEFFNY